MQKVESDIIQFRGNHYDFGYMQGELLRESPLLPNRRKQWDKRWRHFLFEQEEVKTAFDQFAPAIWDELHGLKDALGMTLDEAIKEFGGYYYEYGRSGCSIYTDNGYLIRNYDNDPISYEGRYMLYEPTDSGYAVIGPSMQVTGRTDGMNEKGLTMGYNFVNRKHSGDGFVCNMVGRLILERCANIEEAIAFLKELPHRTSFVYVLQDATGRTAAVEASPRNVVAREANVCTNHFEILTEENRYRVDESMERFDRMTEQKEQVIDPYHAYQLLNHTDQGVFSKKYGAWAGTLHTAAYLPEKQQAWFALGGDRYPLIIDFGKWLNGDKLLFTKIKGELESKDNFINR